MSAAPGPSRRTVLRAGPVALLAGAAAPACTADRPPREPTTPPPPADPDDALREAAAARERALLQEYDAVLLALPALAARLAPVRSHHAEHLAALSAQGQLAPGPSAPAPPTSAAAPADVPAALARLVAAERAAADAHARGCLAASRDLAGVLGSLSASELTHPVALT